MARKVIDFPIGSTVNSMKIIGRAPYDLTKGYRTWFVQCKCGVQYQNSAYNLKKGICISCGCRWNINTPPKVTWTHKKLYFRLHRVEKHWIRAAVYPLLISQTSRGWVKGTKVKEVDSYTERGAAYRV